MVDANLERFRLKLREYRLLVNRNQGDLAAYLNLDYNELSNRLNGHKNTRLSHDNIRAIVRALADWGAITTREQAEELLDMMLCPHFDPVDLQARPLSKLAASPVPAVSLSYPQYLDAPISTTLSKSILQPVSPEPHHNLPKQLSSFIGRHKEVAEIAKLLIEENAPLVTLVGAGGCGKTRLSLHTGEALLSHFPDGVWLVELAPLNNPALIPQTIAEALGVTEKPGRNVLDNLVRYLRQRQILLLLDNCEHLVEECCQLVEKLLGHCNQLQILATSREGLALTGEVTYLVPSLSLPRSEETITLEQVVNYEALELFVERARTTNPQFKLEAEEIGSLVQVCRRLDGIPLALELAAARTRVLSLTQVQSRLDDRFHLLTGGSRTALPRQQTLQALVDWSYNLLTSPEKQLMNRMSVFAGSWNLEAAEQVCSGAGLEMSVVLDSLASLANKSLLVVDKQGKEVRYHMLETIRQYGLEKLRAAREEGEIRERHLRYFTVMVEKFSVKMRNNEQVETLKLFEEELDNLRAALDYALKLEQFETIYQLVSGMAFSWEMRGNYSEAHRYIDQALALPTARGLSQTRLLGIAGYFSFQLGNVYPISLFEERLARIRETNNKETLWGSLMGIGTVCLERGRFVEARGYFEENLAVAQQFSENDQAKTAPMNNLGVALLQLGEYEEARRLFEGAAKIDRELGNLYYLTGPLISQVLFALVLEDYREAHHYLEEVLTISEQIGFQRIKCDALTYLGMALYQEAKFTEAKQVLEASLAFDSLPASRRGATNTLVGVAGLLSKVWLKTRHSALPGQVVCLCGAVSSIEAAKEQVLLMPVRTYYEQALEIARSGLNEADFEEAFARGQRLSLEEATTYTRQALAEV